MPSGQHDDPGVVGAELELVLGEDHAVGDLAAQLRPLERASVGQHRAGHCDADRCAGAEVPRAADDLPRLGLADVDPAELQLVGIRVLPGLEHTAGDEPSEVAVGVGNARPVGALHLGRGDREPLRQLRDRNVEGHVLAQPGDRDLHPPLSRPLLA